MKQFRRLVSCPPVRFPRIVSCTRTMHKLLRDFTAPCVDSTTLMWTSDGYTPLPGYEKSTPSLNVPLHFSCYYPLTHFNHMLPLVPSASTVMRTREPFAMNPLKFPEINYLSSVEGSQPLDDQVSVPGLATSDRVGFSNSFFSRRTSSTPLVQRPFASVYPLPLAFIARI